MPVHALTSNSGMAASSKKKAVNDDNLRDAMPLISLTGDSEDDDNVGEDVNFNRYSVESRKKQYLTGGRRIWKWGDSRLSHRLTALAIIFFASTVLLLFIFLIYPRLVPHPPQPQPQQQQHTPSMWTKSRYCQAGMSALLENCDCIATVNLHSPYVEARRLLLDCMADCLLDDDSDDDTGGNSSDEYLYDYEDTTEEPSTSTNN